MIDLIRNTHLFQNWLSVHRCDNEIYPKVKPGLL